jgi:hypothetical protein
MTASSYNICLTLDESSELEDNVVKWALDDNLQLPYLLKKYSYEASELENCITAHLGYTVGTDMVAVKALQEAMESEIKKMEIARVKLEIAQGTTNHGSANPDFPGEGLNILVKLSCELSELVSNFDVGSSHQQHGEQVTIVDRDLLDPEVSVQHRIACIRKLLCKHREEFLTFLSENSEAKAVFHAFLDEKSNQIVFFQREIGWANRVYVNLLRKIFADMVPNALNKIKECISHLEKLVPPSVQVGIHPFEAWFQDGSVETLLAKAPMESVVLDYSGYGIGRFNDDGWKIFLETLRSATERVPEKVPIKLNLR